MTINYYTKGKVVLTISDYIQDSLSKSPEEFHGRGETPAANYIFNMEKDSEKLNK